MANCQCHLKAWCEVATSGDGIGAEGERTAAAIRANGLREAGTAGTVQAGDIARLLEGGIAGDDDGVDGAEAEGKVLRTMARIFQGALHERNRDIEMEGRHTLRWTLAPFWVMKGDTSWKKSSVMAPRVEC